MQKTNNSELKNPNFFIVGAPKCGTTSLHYWLSQHPEIFMSTPKEPRYFCTDLHEEADNFNNDKHNFFPYRNKNDYLNLFKEANEEKRLGDASVQYLYSKIAPIKIKNETTNPKIIISLRDPIKFIQSLHSHVVGVKRENIKDLNKALNTEKLRINGKKLDPHKINYPSSLYYKKNAHFSKFINYYFNIFDKNDIKIILLDDLKDKPKETYKEILEFLEITDTNFCPQFKIKNPNTEPRLKFLNYLLKKSTKNSNFIKKIYQKIIPKVFRKKIYFFLVKSIRENKKTRNRTTINKKLESKLKKEFKPEVERLSKITNRDLITLWGYE